LAVVGASASDISVKDWNEFIAGEASVNTLKCLQNGILIVRAKAIECFAVYKDPLFATEVRVTERLLHLGRFDSCNQIARKELLERDKARIERLCGIVAGNCNDQAIKPVQDLLGRLPCGFCLHCRGRSIFGGECYVATQPVNRRGETKRSSMAIGIAVMAAIAPTIAQIPGFV